MAKLMLRLSAYVEYFDQTPSAYIAKEEFSDIYTASIIIGSHAGSQVADG
jgi:hypothetical protein